MTGTDCGDCTAGAWETWAGAGNMAREVVMLGGWRAIMGLVLVDAVGGGGGLYVSGTAIR